MMNKSHMEGDKYLILQDDKNRAERRNVIARRNKILTRFLGTVYKAQESLNFEKNRGKKIVAQHMGRGI